MESQLKKPLKKYNKKLKRKLFGRMDRFLAEDFGKDITKKIKNIQNSENPTNQIATPFKDILKYDSIIEKPNIDELDNKKTLKNRRYEINYSDSKVDAFIKGLKLAPQDNFIGVSRNICPSCKKNRSLYCPECIIPVIHEESVPKVSLPVQLTL